MKMRKLGNFIAAICSALLLITGFASVGPDKKTVSAAPLPPTAEALYDLSTVWERTGYVDGRFYCYRLPGIVTLTDGTLLSYCEKRIGQDGSTASSDQAVMNLVAKRVMTAARPGEGKSSSWTAKICFGRRRAWTNSFPLPFRDRSWRWTDRKSIAFT